MFISGLNNHFDLRTSFRAEPFEYRLARFRAVEVYFAFAVCQHCLKCRERERLSDRLNVARVGFKQIEFALRWELLLHLFCPLSRMSTDVVNALNESRTVLHLSQASLEAQGATDWSQFEAEWI